MRCAAFVPRIFGVQTTRRTRVRKAVRRPLQGFQMIEKFLLVMAAAASDGVAELLKGRTHEEALFAAAERLANERAQTSHPDFEDLTPKGESQ